jgi:hypothetical protein
VSRNLKYPSKSVQLQALISLVSSRSWRVVRRVCVYARKPYSPIDWTRLESRALRCCWWCLGGLLPSFGLIHWILEVVRFCLVIVFMVGSALVCLAGPCDLDGTMVPKMVEIVLQPAMWDFDQLLSHCLCMLMTPYMRASSAMLNE